MSTETLRALRLVHEAALAAGGVQVTLEKVTSDPGNAAGGKAAVPGSQVTVSAAVGQYRTEEVEGIPAGTSKIQITASDEVDYSGNDWRLVSVQGAPAAAFENKGFEPILAFGGVLAYVMPVKM